jgi:hypothetical protein
MLALGRFEEKRLFLAIANYFNREPAALPESRRNFGNHVGIFESVARDSQQDIAGLNTGIGKDRGQCAFTHFKAAMSAILTPGNQRGLQFEYLPAIRRIARRRRRSRSGRRRSATRHIVCEGELHFAAMLAQQHMIAGDSE